MFRRYRVEDALTAVEHEGVPEDEPPPPIRNGLHYFADDCAAVAVTDQHDVGEVVTDDEIHDRLGGLGVGDLLVDSVAVSGHRRPERVMAVIFQPLDDKIP